MSFGLFSDNYEDKETVIFYQKSHSRHCKGRKHVEIQVSSDLKRGEMKRTKVILPQPSAIDPHEYMDAEQETGKKFAIILLISKSSKL